MRLYLSLFVLGCVAGSAMAGYEGRFIQAAFLSMMGVGLLVMLYRLTPVPTAKPDHGHNCKPSKCCPGELLVPMHSTDTKLCTGCKVEHPWNLEPGQKRTFN